MVTKQDLEELVAFDPAGIPVVSFYLNTAGNRYTLLQCVERTHQLVRQTRTELPARGLAEESLHSVEADLNEITRLIGTTSDWRSGRGVAYVGCGHARFRRLYVLDAPPPDLLAVDVYPHVRPLAENLNGARTYGVVLVDRERARIFAAHQGAVREIEQIHDDVPGRVRVGTWYGLRDNKIERHIDDHVRQHHRHVAESVMAHIQSGEIDAILLAGSDDDTAAFAHAMPRPLAERVTGDVQGLMMIAPLDDVRLKALEVIGALEAASGRDLVRRVCDAACGNGYGVLGLGETLQRLYGRAVDTLVVDDRYTAPGRVCAACGRLYDASSGCPECGGSGCAVQDIVEAAVATALRQEASVRVVARSSDWPAAEPIGALLRYVPSASGGPVATLALP